MKGSVGLACGRTDLDVFDGERLFKDVGRIGTARERTKRCQVATVAAERFTDESPVLAALSRLLHTITNLPPTNSSQRSQHNASDYLV